MSEIHLDCFFIGAVTTMALVVIIELAPLLTMRGL